MPSTKTKRYIYVIEHDSGEHMDVSLFGFGSAKFFSTEAEALAEAIKAAHEMHENRFGEFDEKDWTIYSVEVGAVISYGLEVTGVSPVNPRKL